MIQTFNPAFLEPLMAAASRLAFWFVNVWLGSSSLIILHLDHQFFVSIVLYQDNPVFVIIIIIYPTSPHFAKNYFNPIASRNDSRADQLSASNRYRASRLPGVTRVLRRANVKLSAETTTPVTSETSDTHRIRKHVEPYIEQQQQ